MAVLQRCVGCQVLADKQTELGEQDESTHGMKVALVPAAAHAALEMLRDLKKNNGTHDD